MKSLILLFFLAQFWGCRSAPHGPGLGFRQPDCDDPEVEQAALVAVDYINSHLLHGFKHILNQVDKVKVWSQPMGEVYELEIDTLETTCHALDPTPLANCPVRGVAQHAVEGDCDFRLLKQGGQFSVQFANCHSSPDSAEDVSKVCPTCPLLALLNDSKVVQAVETALASFNAKSNGSYYQLVEVSRAQHVPLPELTYVEFVVAATDCVAKDVTDPATCKPLAEKQYSFCKATLSKKLGEEELSVACTNFQAQPVEAQPPSDGDIQMSPPHVMAQGAPGPSPAGSPAASLVVGPMMVPGPQGPLSHRAHYDLRHAFSGVASVESASGEAFHPGKKLKVSQPSAAGAAGPLVRPCPGRIRHFKI